MDFRRLIPEPGIVDVQALLSTAGFAERGQARDRPYTIANFVTSADGRATFAGRSGKLGDDGDRAMFHALREQVDAVIAGSRTLAAEHYGRLIPEVATRRRRMDKGLPGEPLVCIVSRSGELPANIPLFAEPTARIVLFSPAQIELNCAARVELVHLDPGELNLTTVVRRLRADHDVRSLLCEGGPTLFGAFLHEGVVDELFLTLAPKLAGGGAGPMISIGPALPALAQLRVEWALERNSSLYLRYALR